METFNSLFLAIRNNVSNYFENNVAAMLMAVCAGMIAMKIASRINDTQARNEHEDEEAEINPGL